MKTYNVIIGGKNIEVLQNEDGTFIKPQILEELNKFGTALKPAFEPICMAMKPLSEKNFATNVLKYGTGGINIDESRVEAPNEDTGRKNISDVKDTDTVGNWGMKAHDSSGRIGEGRFPANLIWSCNEDEYMLKSNIEVEDFKKLKEYYDNQKSSVL